MVITRGQLLLEVGETIVDEAMTRRRLLLEGIIRGCYIHDDSSSVLCEAS